MTVPRRLVSGLLLALLLVPAAARPAAAAGSSTAPAPASRASAVFAGGCFWCLETAFEDQPGVLAAVSGYAGGTKKNPKYEEVGMGLTGHAESVEVTYDPARTSYTALLDLFWHNVDPTQADGQFCDHGKQYRSAIFWRTPAEHQAALASKLAIEKSGVLRGRPIVTQVVPAGPFWRAEEYHQDFWKKDPDRYFSYREGCGRDARLHEIWGDKAGRSKAYPEHEPAH